MKTYIINGTIDYFILKEVKKITGDNPHITFDFECNTIDDLINEASFVSMFDDIKYILVKNAKIFDSSVKGTDNTKIKKDLEKLSKYLKDENDKVVLIFITVKKPDIKKKEVKLINEAGNLINISSMRKYDMRDELLKYFTKYEYKIADKELWYIINNCQNNFDIAIKEADKIMIYLNLPGIVSSSVVEKLVCTNINNNNFLLIDSIINRKLVDSLENMQIIKTYKIDPFIIFMGLASEIRKTYYLYLLKKNNVLYNDILSYLKIADFQYQKYEKYLRIYNEEELKDIILNLADIDFELKSKNTDKEVLLYKYIMENCE